MTASANPEFPMADMASIDLEAMQAHSDEAARLLRTLGNAQRLRILCLLVGHELTVGDLNAQLPDLSQSALSQHLARLREEGMVSARRESLHVWYALAEGPAQVIVATLHGIYCPAPETKVG